MGFFTNTAAFLIVYSYGFFCGYAATLRIKNFSVDRTQSFNNDSVFFVFGTDPYISSSTASTYEVILYWTEKFSGYSSSMTISRYSTQCSTTGYFTTDGSTHHFSVSKYSLGSGPLSINISVSLGCYNYYGYCNSRYRCRGIWRYMGTSDVITIDSIRGSYAPFEVNIQLWPGERCNEFVNTYPNMNSLLSVIKDACQCSTSQTTIYQVRYMCVRDGVIAVRGVLARRNDTMATIQLKALENTLDPEHPVIIGKRWLTLRAGACGLSITSIDAPLCDKGNPGDTGNSPITIPKVWNGDIVIQGGSASSSAPSGHDDASLKTAIVAVAVVCAVAVFAVLGLVVYIGYTKYYRRRKEVVRYRSMPDSNDTGHLTFEES